MARIPKARQIKYREAPVLDEALTQVDAKPERRKREGTIADQLAINAFHFARDYWPKSRELFPTNRDMQICDKHYPLAEGGALWVDEERTIAENRNFELKAKAMREQGLRYVVIKKNMTLDEAMELML